jgi:hypothetical protein
VVRRGGPTPPLIKKWSLRKEISLWNLNPEKIFSRIQFRGRDRKGVGSIESGTKLLVKGRFQIR